MYREQYEKRFAESQLKDRAVIASSVSHPAWMIRRKIQIKDTCTCMIIFPSLENSAQIYISTVYYYLTERFNIFLCLGCSIRAASHGTAIVSWHSRKVVKNYFSVVFAELWGSYMGILVISCFHFPWNVNREELELLTDIRDFANVFYVVLKRETSK